MNPFLLRDTLAELAGRLPPEDEEAEPHDFLEEIVSLLDAQLGPGQALYMLDDGGAAHLPQDLKNLFELLCYLQALAQFLTTMTCDGLCPVFYHGKGNDLNQLRQCLQRFDPDLSGLVEAAYALLAPRLDIRPDRSFAASHPGVDPFDHIDDAAFAALEAIEHQIDANWDRYFDNAMVAYNARDRG